MILTLAILVWFLIGFLNYGLTLGYFTHLYPPANHMGIAVAFLLAGPFALPVSLIDPPYHWRVIPLTTEERWQAYHRDRPNGNRDDFERSYN